MAELKIPVRIDGYNCVEEITQAVLDYTYKGKTLKEWADSISEPQTNADRIRAMTDEELAKFLLNRDLYVVEKASKAVGFTYKVDRKQSLANVIDWLKQEATE